MPRDDFVNKVDRMPASLGGENLALFRRDLNNSHSIASTILSCLSDVLKPKVRFEDHHRFEEASQSTSMYFRYLKQTPDENTTAIAAGIGHNMHTDLGTLTLLYSEDPGLQVYNQSLNTWEWVAPKSQHYIVNVGDALRFLSDKRLLSSLHRVVPYPGLEGKYRYSSAYFLRPDDGAQFMTSEGTVVSALQWNDLKYATFKAKHVDQEKNTVLTGGVVTI
jgi:isopenicillin N synthase-like dioxygenase